MRDKLSRVRNSIALLSARSLAVHPASIMDVYAASLEHHARDMLRPELLAPLTAAAALRASEL
jgi:hypothetical protein